MNVNTHMSQEELNKLCDSNKMVVCFDIDGTLSELEIPNGDLTKAIPKANVIKNLKRLFTNGNYIILYTGRNSHKKVDTMAWLKIQNIPYHELHFGKPKAHLYIDDSTVDVEEYLDDPILYENDAREHGNNINQLIRTGKL